MCWKIFAQRIEGGKEALVRYRYFLGILIWGRSIERKLRTIFCLLKFEATVAVVETEVNIWIDNVAGKAAAVWFQFLVTSIYFGTIG